MKENIIEIYMNYLYALRIREEYGDLYGDTDEIIEYYESKLNKYLNNSLGSKVKTKVRKYK